MIEKPAAYEWQKSRRKPDGHFDMPVTGFGEGGHTLWLPSPKTESRLRFVDGQPERVHDESCLNTLEIRRLRDLTIKSFAMGPTGLLLDLSFIQYTVAVLRINYKLNDDDLAFLLNGAKWHTGMISHLLGGDDTVESLCNKAPAVIERLYGNRNPPTTDAPPAPVPAILMTSATALDLSED